MNKDKGHGPLKPDTILTHAGRDPQKHFGFVNVPVFHASTILNPTVAQRRGRKAGATPAMAGAARRRSSRSRTSSPRSRAASAAIITPSGLAAVAVALLAFLRSGDHVLMADCVYGPARRLGGTLLKRWGSRSPSTTRRSRPGCPS